MSETSQLQGRVRTWVVQAFGYGVADNRQERIHRFIEEALELAQALDCPKDEVLMLVDYVYNRPVGEVRQEVGGVFTTLCALCSAIGVDLEIAAKTELMRCWERIEIIRQKQATKPKSGPLPE